MHHPEMDTGPSRVGRRSADPRSPTWAGGALIGCAILIGLSGLLVPLPAFEDLAQREGTVLEVRRERVPCRVRECHRTMVSVRHGRGIRTYHFGDVDPATIEAGTPIRIAVHREFRTGTRERVWHAEQDGRVLLEYAGLAAVDRRLRLVLLLGAPLLLATGVWLIRRSKSPSRQV